MNELEASIADVGLLNRIIVRPLENTTDEYEIISGHRRVKAAKELGMKEIPAIVYSGIDRDEAKAGVFPLLRLQRESWHLFHSLHPECRSGGNGVRDDSQDSKIYHGERNRLPLSI